MSNQYKSIIGRNDRPSWRWDHSELIQSIEKKGKNDCWIWVSKYHSSEANGTTDRPLFKAYVKSDVRKASVNPQRIVYANHHGKTLFSTEQIYTTCGNRNCMNPNHLFVGSKEDLRVKEFAFAQTKYSCEWLLENLEEIRGCRSKKKLMEKYNLTANQVQYIRMKTKKITEYQEIDLRTYKNGLSQNIQQSCN